MAEHRDDIERFLAVGQVAVIQTEPNRKEGPRFPTTFLGWRRGRAIYIEHPRTLEGRDVAFRDGQTCVLRFVHDGQACAFTAGVLDWTGARGEAQVRLRWPESIETLVLRRFDRIPYHGPVQARLARGEMLIGHFGDLSLGGCGVLLPQNVSKGEVIQLSFSLPDGAEIQNLAVTVKMARQTAEGNFLGCEMEPGQEASRNDIALFVTAELTRSRGGAANAGAEPRALIVEPNQNTVATLRKLLARHNIEILATSSTVDVFHSVRALPLHAVAIRHDLPEIPGVEVCRLIRNARGLDTLPLFLYDGEGLDPHIKGTGITKWLPSSPSLLTEIVIEIKRAAEVGRAK